MKEKFKQIWEEATWPLQARKVIHGINEFPKNSKIILILRHSHRKHSADPVKLSKLTLTPQGLEIAKIFGRHLPKDRPIRLFHSIVDRCIETAENILAGFKEVGGSGEIKGTLESLYNIGSDGPYIIKKAIEHQGQEFLNRWSAGLFLPEKVKSLSDYSIESANEIWNLQKYAPERGIDIHISHDLSIMGFRLGWFGLSTQNWWVAFMGGIAFTFQNSEILLFDRGQMKPIELPYWWNSQ